MKPRPIIIWSLMILVLLMASCATRSDAPPTPTPTAAPQATASATASPTSTATSVPTPQTVSEPVADGKPVPLSTFVNESMNITGLAPAAWHNVAAGVYARGNMTTDPTTIIQQAAPGMRASQLSQAILPSLGLQSLPESIGKLEANDLGWQLYTLSAHIPDGGDIKVALALAETSRAAYLVLLQTHTDEHDALFASVFEPAVAAMTALADDEPTRALFR